MTDIQKNDIVFISWLTRPFNHLSFKFYPYTQYPFILRTTWHCFFITSTEGEFSHRGAQPVNKEYSPFWLGCMRRVTSPSHVLTAGCATFRPVSHKRGPPVKLASTQFHSEKGKTSHSLGIIPFGLYSWRGRTSVLTRCPWAWSPPRRVLHIWQRHFPGTGFWLWIFHPASPPLLLHMPFQAPAACVCARSLHLCHAVRPGESAGHSRVPGCHSHSRWQGMMRQRGWPSPKT